MKNNGVYVSLEVFEVEGKRKVFCILLIYDMDDDENIIEIFNDYNDILLSVLILFVFDLVGNLICFDYKNYKEDLIVVFWEYEGVWEKEILMESEGIMVEEVEERVRENVFCIVNDFMEFLNKLYD